MNFLLRTPTCLNPANGSYMGYRPRPERVKRRNYAKKSYEKIKDIKTDIDFVIAFIDE